MEKKIESFYLDQIITSDYIEHLKQSVKVKYILCPQSANTCWIFPKLAIVVRMGTRPFIAETMTTVRISEKLAKEQKPIIKNKLRIRLVFNDLAAAAISEAANSSTCTPPPLQFSFMIGVAPCGFSYRKNLHCFIVIFDALYMKIQMCAARVFLNCIFILFSIKSYYLGRTTSQVVCIQTH